MRTQRQVWPRRKIFIVSLAITIMLIASVLLSRFIYGNLWPYRNNDPPLYFGLKLNITSSDITVSKDRFIEIETEVHNPTLAPIPKACSRQEIYYVDGRAINNEPSFSGLCWGSSSDYKPGETFKYGLAINPTMISEGVHTFYVMYDGSRSNTIRITVTKARSITNCYEFTEYPTPLCSQIRLSSLTSGTDISHDFCQAYLDYILAKTPLRPLASQKHITCDANSQSPIPEIVANIPKDDPDHWMAKLEKLYGGKETYLDAEFAEFGNPRAH